MPVAGRAEHHTDGGTSQELSGLVEAFQEIPKPYPSRLQDEAPRAPTLRARLERYERRLICVALERAGGNQRRAARVLGMAPSTLCTRLKRLGIAVVRQVVDLQR
jgi:transcriptional regulator with GAF, ATPase, and Fis domain